MGRSRRVLIVSAGTGNGHVRAGEALKAAARLYQPSWRVEHLDVLTLAPRWLRLAYGGGFELLATRAPRVWGGIYRWADGPEDDHARWAAVAERTVFRSFRRLLLQGGWDLCICTHFLPAQLAAGRAGMPPCSLVVTDYTLHRYWAQPRVSNYFVARPELALDIRARISDAHVQVTGIPIDPAFAQSISRQDARRQIGLDVDRPVITVMGGGFGLNIEDHIEPLLAAGVDDAQLLVICGRNVAARTRLEQRKLPARVHVLGFVNGVRMLMAAADIVVTKPGGLTTSEALALGRPLLLTRPLPGHEEGNADVLVGLGAAQRVDRPGALAAAVRSLFEEPQQLATMSNAAISIGRRQAAQIILQHAEAGMSRAAAA